MRLTHHTTFNPWREASLLPGPRVRRAAWTPPFDIVETDAAFLVSGDLPGLAQKDIEVRVEDGMLTVRGERKPAEAAERFGRRERAHGRFERRFRLSDAVDADAIEASYADGVLVLELPKRQTEDASRLIPVN